MAGKHGSGKQVKVSSSRRIRGAHRAKSDHPEPYRWLGAGAVTVGLGIALTGGIPVAHAQGGGRAGEAGAGGSTSSSGSPSPSDRSLSRSSDSSSSSGSKKSSGKGRSGQTGLSAGPSGATRKAPPVTSADAASPTSRSKKSSGKGRSGQTGLSAGPSGATRKAPPVTSADAAQRPFLQRSTRWCVRVMRGWRVQLRCRYPMSPMARRRRFRWRRQWDCRRCRLFPRLCWAPICRVRRSRRR